MASGDVIDFVRHTELSPGSGPEGWTPQYPQVGDGQRGVRLRKLDSDFFFFEVQIPANGTPLSTGLTFKLALAEASRDADPGKVVRLGVLVKKIASGTDDETVTGAGTEGTVDVTLDATTGQVVVGSLAITTANADTPAAGDRVLVRVRRIGTAAEDTHSRSVVLLGITVSDT